MVLLCKRTSEGIGRIPSYNLAQIIQYPPYSLTETINRGSTYRSESDLGLGVYDDLPSYRRGGFLSGFGGFLSAVGEWLSELDSAKSTQQDRLMSEQLIPQLDKFSRWYDSRGVDVKVYTDRDVLDGLIKDLAEKGRDQDVGAILAGYVLGQNSVIITDYELVIPGIRSSTGMEDVGEVYVNAMRKLRNRRTLADIQYEGDFGTKVFVGGAHTHPKHDPFLSSIDIEGLRAIVNHARKNPEAYAQTGGNLELVFNPKSDRYTFFKIMTDGSSERIPVDNIMIVGIN